MKKICSKCNINKSLKDFYFRKDTKKYRNECIPCWNHKEVKDWNHIKTEFIPSGGYGKKYLKDDIKLLQKFIKRDVQLPQEIKRCLFCARDISGLSKIEYYYKNGYCSEWCWEVMNPPTLKHFCPCGNVKNTHIYKTGKKIGQRTGTYAKNCEECILKRKLLTKQKQLCTQ